MKQLFSHIEASQYQDATKLLLKDVSHKIAVEFCIYCLQDIDQYYDVVKYKDVYESKNKVLELLGSWIIDPKSVTKKELDAAAYAANAAANAAYAAANAAYAAAYAAYAAAYAAYAAASAANAAYAASYAAANAAVSKKQLKYLITLLYPNNKLIQLELI